MADFARDEQHREVYTMQRYLQAQTLRTASRTLTTGMMPSIELRPDDTYQEVMRLKDFGNLEFLSRMVPEIMDYVIREFFVEGQMRPIESLTLAQALFL